MSEHLGYDKHDPAGRNRANSRNGTRTKTVLTEVGPVAIEVPRDRHAVDVVNVRRYSGWPGADRPAVSAMRGSLLVACGDR
jgi:hypothetical protein